DGDGLDPQRPGQLLGERDALARRVLAREQDAEDLRRSDGVGGDGGRERRVDPAREAHEGPLEPVLAQVVLCAEDQGLVDLGRRTRPGGEAAGDRGTGSPRGAGAGAEPEYGP